MAVKRTHINKVKGPMRFLLTAESGTVYRAWCVQCPVQSSLGLCQGLRCTTPGRLLNLLGLCISEHFI